MAKKTDEHEEEIKTIEPAPGQDDGSDDAVRDPGAESTYGTALPNHNALLPQPGEKGAPDNITHFKVTAAGVSVPVVFVDSDGATRVTSEGKYRGEIHKREVFGDEERIAHLLGLKAIEPVKQ